MARAVKSPMPTLLPNLKIPTASQLAVESQRQALLRQALEALDVGTPPNAIVQAMQRAGFTQEEAMTIVREAYLQLECARSNAAHHLDSVGHPGWYAAKRRRMAGWGLVVLNSAASACFAFGPSNGIKIPNACCPLGDQTWMLGAVGVLLGAAMIISADGALKRIRRTALTKLI